MNPNGIRSDLNIKETYTYVNLLIGLKKKHEI